jgi:hypothetical protein
VKQDLHLIDNVFHCFTSCTVTDDKGLVDVKVENKTRSRGCAHVCLQVMNKTVASTENQEQESNVLTLVNGALHVP